VKSDPATRFAYVAALRANAERNQRIATQRHLRTIDEEVTTELQLMLQQFHGHAPDDTAALDAIVKRAGIRSPRKLAIHAMY